MGSLIKSQAYDETTTALWFGPDEWVPNSRGLPVLHYRSALSASAASAAAIERVFDRNLWPARWRNGIYDYHHYHSTAHEALGIAHGHADVLIGGPHGRRLALSAGDCVVLPAGTGHCLLAASANLLVVGAYPPDQDWDLRRDALSRTEIAAMARLPVPATDPVTGRGGVLVELWGAA